LSNKLIEQGRKLASRYPKLRSVLRTIRIIKRRGLRSNLGFSGGELQESKDKYLAWFHKNLVFQTTKWLGRPISKTPFDIWIMQEIIYETKPSVIIEIGNLYGGSALYFANLFDILGFNISQQVYLAKKNLTVSVQINTLFLISTTIAGLILLTINPIVALLCISGSFFMMYQASLMGLKLYKKYMLNSILKSVIYLAFPLTLYFVLEIPGIVLGMVISNLLASIPYYRTLRMKSFFWVKKIL